MRRQIFVESVPGEVRVALVEDGALAEVFIERAGLPGISGNVYLGRVRNILPGMQSAFVDLGLERDGFLYVEDAPGGVSPQAPEQANPGEESGRAPGRAAGPPPRIEYLLKEGQELLVQVAKGPMAQKGARITTHIALPGRLLVFLPGVAHVGVSRRIESAEERERLRAAVCDIAVRESLPGGFIVRTAGAGLLQDSFLSDAEDLARQWSAILARRDQARAPALLHQEAGALERALRDLFDEEVREVVVDSKALQEEADAFMKRSHPSMAGRVRRSECDGALFEAEGLAIQLERALRPKVWLKSGGYIVVNQTEALVAIDVNTGKYVGRARPEETIVRTNLEAAREVVRQIRLRDLGGIIVIDFIDMDEKESRAQLITVLEEELRKDRARSRMLQISEFGLVEITRQRTRPSLERFLCRPCTACGGTGQVKTHETLGFEIVREGRKHAPLLAGRRLVVRVHPETAAALQPRCAALAEAAGLRQPDGLVFEIDPTLRPDRFVVQAD